MGQVKAIRFGLNQILWNVGVMEYWNVGFRVSGVGYHSVRIVDCVRLL